MAAKALARGRVWAWLIDALVAVGLKVLGDGLFVGQGWIASATYWLIRDGLFDGQSIGKRLSRLKVVVGLDEKPCSLVDSCVRNFLWIIPIANIVMGVTGLHYLLHDRRGQHWGDRLASTTVVSAD